MLYHNYRLQRKTKRIIVYSTILWHEESVHYNNIIKQHADGSTFLQN